jgi:hypothetical protein
MALDISANSPPYVYRLTLSSTVDELTEVTLPKSASRVSVQFITNAGKLTFAGTDGAAIGSHYASIAADSWSEVTWSNRTPAPQDNLFLASGTASTVVEILIEFPDA